MSKFADSVLRYALASLPCLLVLFLTSPAAAQEVTATISGTVADPSGEIIPAVTVEVNNPAPGPVPDDHFASGFQNVSTQQHSPRGQSESEYRRSPGDWTDHRAGGSDRS